MRIPESFNFGTPRGLPGPFTFSAAQPGTSSTEEKESAVFKTPTALKKNGG